MYMYIAKSMIVRNYRLFNFIDSMKNVRFIELLEMGSMYMHLYTKKNI